METMNKVDMDWLFVEYMEGIGYDVPEVVTTEDILDMCIKHWEDSLKGVVRPTAQYCGLCQMYDYRGGCAECPLQLYKAAVIPDEDHPWDTGCANHWQEEDIKRMISVLKDVRTWYLDMDSTR